SRPARTDWRFVDERPGFTMGESTVRYATTVSGNEVTGFEEFVHVPEAWKRAYERLRSKNNTANLVGNFFLILTFLAMIVVLIEKIVRKDIPWKLVAGFGAIAFLLALLSTLNGVPLSLFNYDTASPLSGHLAKEIIFGILGAVAIGAFIALVMASSEPIYRERFPEQLSLPGLFSRRGLRSKGFFRGLLLGYAMTAFFFAYQAVFYVAAARMGAWAPADIPYDDILNTALPWATVLFIGFLPAVLEEGSSRLFSISFLDRLGGGRFVAVVLPAFIWGFNHAAYPNQPFYIRGLEVGLAGVAIGFLMLRFGALPLLVWHFTVDALYTALLLLRSKNAYYVVTGGVSALILLLPLAAALLLYWRRGGFEPATGLTNRELGSAPPPPAAAPVSETVAWPRPVPRSVFLG
ncbi:MAG: CPBP family glutamic-type intramembrane protease, partial [Thermoanaerobaculia bacterium]